MQTQLSAAVRSRHPRTSARVRRRRTGSHRTGPHVAGSHRAGLRWDGS
jgi:hypothetical protein